MSDLERVDQKKAAFFGRVAAEWIDDRRDMVLIEPFVYRDSKGEVWQVPEGTIIDGASIPRFLWPFIGSPYVGHYRNASVVHDYYCEYRTRPSADVHWMFYDACLTSGVSQFKAYPMYIAVIVYGTILDAYGAMSEL